MKPPVVINVNIPRLNMATARVIAGAGAFALTVFVFGAMYLKPELAKDDLFKMLAQAVVIQGLVGLVMAFLFTGQQEAASPPPPRDARRAAERVADAADDEAAAIREEGTQG